MIQEKDIVYQAGRHWVLKEKNQYTVHTDMPNGSYSVSDSSYLLDEDGLSLAKARCDYLNYRDGLLDVLG